jgi:hypothetical protein
MDGIDLLIKIREEGHMNESMNEKGRGNGSARTVRGLHIQQDQMTDTIETKTEENKTQGPVTIEVIYPHYFSSNRQDETRYDWDNRSVSSTSKPEAEKSRTHPKLPPPQQPSSLVEPKLHVKSKAVAARSLLDEQEENEPSLSKGPDSNRSNTTKGKKHMDFGGIEVIANDRLGKKVRVKCHSDDTVGDLKVCLWAPKTVMLCKAETNG